MGPITEPDDESSILIDRSPEAVWAVVADVTRIPEWSPVCHRVDRLEGDRYRGHNKLNGVRWTREFQITESDPPRTLAFSTLFKGEESTRWRYRLEPDGARTRVTEAYQVVTVPPWLRLLRRLPGMVAKSERDTRWNIETSLQRLKTLVER